MILSAELLYSDDQDLAQTAGAYPSTNYIDHGAPGTPHGGNALTPDIAHGEPVPLEVLVTEAIF